MRRAAWRSMASRIALSVFESTAESGSSRMRIFGSHTSARASAMRCFCPPESCTPRSPTTVSKPSGSDERLFEHLRLAGGVADLDLRGRPSRDRRARSRCCAQRSSRRETRLAGRSPMADRTDDSGSSQTSMPSMRTAPVGRGQEAREEHRERRLARARAPDDGERLARRHLEAHVVEHLARPVREASGARRERAARRAAARGAARRPPRAARRRRRAGARSRRARAARCSARSRPRSSATSCARTRSRTRRTPPARCRRASGPRRSSDEPYQKKTRIPIAATAPMVGRERAAQPGEREARVQVLAVGLSRSARARAPRARSCARRARPRGSPGARRSCARAPPGSRACGGTARARRRAR